MKNIFNLIYITAISLFGGICLSHYLEPVQINTFLKIRNIFYFSTSSSKELVDGMTYSKYKGLDSSYFNPVNYIQSLWPDIYAVLSKNIDKNYFESNSDFFIDTGKLIQHSDRLMNFVDTVIIHNTVCYRLPYKFPEESYSISSGWYSGMAQGHAIELMIAVYFLTNDSIYLRNAERFANLLNVDVKDGGVKENVDGGIWFEEYAQYDSHRKSPLVLNGHIFAMDGLYALSVVSENTMYKVWLHQSLEAVEKNINKYAITKYWSYYDLYSSPSITDWSYHNIHIQQLKRLIVLNKQVGKDDLPEITSTYRNFQLGKLIPVGIFVRLFYMHNNMLLFGIAINSFIVFCFLLTYIFFWKRNG